MSQKFDKDYAVGFKCFNHDMTCRGFQFEVGKTYEHYGIVWLCASGFHFHENKGDILEYYDSHSVVCEVECWNVLTGDDKSACQKIKVVRQLHDNELNMGKGCTGRLNSGDRNSGDRNSGNQNPGNWNSGDRNSGNQNSGNQNSGNWNSGDRNSGDRNSGYRNSGNWNSGYRNSGNWNSGDRNSGNQNSGNQNSGDRNSGNWNSGDRNSGNWNSGDRNSGYFNSQNPEKILVFNRPCDRSEFEKVNIPDWLYFSVSKWISSGDMTEEEKSDHPEHKTIGGYLKVMSYKEAAKKSYKRASRKDQLAVKKIPNFDKDIFFEIFGIDIDEDK